MLKSFIAFLFLTAAVLGFSFTKKNINRNLASNIKVRKELTKQGLDWRQTTNKETTDKQNINKQRKLNVLKKRNKDLRKTKKALKKRQETLKKFSPSKLIKEFKDLENLPKPKRFQVLRATAKRFIPDSFLFYLAGNIVSVTDHGAGISKIDNPRFFQTEIDSVSDPAGGAHFFTFIFFNQMYASWSQKKIQSGTASVLLNKFLKSSANIFAGMAVAGLGASIVSDLGSMIYHCSLNKLQKVQDKQESDIFATAEAHFAACDDLYLSFVSGKMEAVWINDLMLGLIPAAVLSHGVSAAAKSGFTKIKHLNRWKEIANSSKPKAAGAARKGKAVTNLAKTVSKLKTVASFSWVGALVNFSLFVGIERLLMRHATEWGSKKINLGFLNSYKNTITNYIQNKLSQSWQLTEPDKKLTLAPSLIQCSDKHCIQNYYRNLKKQPNEKNFLHALKLYSQTFRERRTLLLARGQMNYQNWISSLAKLTTKYEASFRFYYDFVKKISEKDPAISLKLMPLAYILSGKKINKKFIKAAGPDQATEQVTAQAVLNPDQKTNLSEALIFLKNKVTDIKHSTWSTDKSQRLVQLTELRRQIFSQNSDLQLIGFKNLSTLTRFHQKQGTCKSTKLDKNHFLKKVFLRSKQYISNKDIFCSVIDLHKFLGEPNSKSYLEDYIQAHVSSLTNDSKVLSKHHLAKNLPEEFLISMVCGKSTGGVFNITGWDKGFYSPKITTLNNNHCTFKSVKTPYAYMLCDKDMSNKQSKNRFSKPNNIYNIKNSNHATAKTLDSDFQCAELWGVNRMQVPEYSVMHTYFGVKQNNQIKTYNNLAELVIANLDKKVLSCPDQNCKKQLAEAKLENKDTSVFEIWWREAVDPQIIKILVETKLKKQKILETQILPVLYTDLKQQNNKEDLSIVALLSADIQSLSVMSSLKHEALVYKKIIEKIYKQHCSSDLCDSEFKEWSKDLSLYLGQLLKNEVDTDFSLIQKLSKILKLSYQNLFYTMLPSPTVQKKYYFTKINKITKLSSFEEKIIKRVFKSLNAQIFEIESYRSLLIEREKN